MYPITPELIDAINADRLSNAEEHRIASSLKSRSGFRQILQRMALSAVKR